MSGIRAIETEWAGYLFRSRLEARWAVFFDALGLDWRYEPEGYKLSDGRCYLPDFYLPSLGVFAEVKPTEQAVDWPLLETLAEETGSEVLALVDVPAHAWYEICGTKSTYDGGNHHDWVDLIESACRGRCWYAFCGEDRPPKDYLVGYQYTDFDRDDAVFAARSARFEHGESPAVRHAL